MIVTRYLIREINKPLLALSLALVAIFAGYSAAVFLTQAANGVLPTNVVVELIALKTNIALEVLLPIALYLAVIIALGRLHTDSEMTALHALGVSPLQVLRAVSYLALTFAVLIAVLAFYVRPWSYERSYQLKARANAEFSLSDVKPGSFNENASGTRVIFAAGRAAAGGLERVFMQREHGRRTQVLYAMRASQERDPRYDAPLLHMRDVHLYDLSRDGGVDRIVRVARLTYHMNEPPVKPVGFQRKAASMSRLAASHTAPDIAEYQWRLSTPLSTVLLAILGIPLSRARPRQGRYAKMLVAVLVYAGYYSLDIMLKVWVGRGVLGTLPGVWLAPGALALVALTAWHQPLATLRRRRAGAAQAHP
ncbi:lipopolysaccharide export system permease protein LptF [bacterium BMS3Abin12]|nr:lipopolysaccharide export system permease protein LptF [bacterium BMS3Abin12]